MHMGSRFKSLMEIVLVFILLAVVHNLVFYLPYPNFLGPWAGDGLNVIFFIAATIIILVLLVVTKRDFAQYGITLRNKNNGIKIAAICIVPVLLIRLLCFTPVVNNSFWWIVVSALFLLMLLVIAVILTIYPKDGNKQATTLLIIFPALFLLPLPEKVAAFAALFIYAFIILGPVEELIFRGYMQSRLNEAFGRPHKFFGVSWGTGIVITSLLFWLWHFWNPFYPFSLFGSSAIPSIWIFFAGLTYGFIREKSGSIVAPALVHAAFDFPLFVSMAMA